MTYTAFLGHKRIAQGELPAVARAAALLGLNEQEEAYLTTCRIVKGIGATALLLADGERTPLMIPMWRETILGS